MVSGKEQGGEREKSAYGYSSLGLSRALFSENWKKKGSNFCILRNFPVPSKIMNQFQSCKLLTGRLESPKTTFDVISYYKDLKNKLKTFSRILKK